MLSLFKLGKLSKSYLNYFGLVGLWFELRA